jgi:pyruvate/2-oxoglutarate dehydrogenase complex dihydrolipoamide acyltransferase (E2) component
MNPFAPLVVPRENVNDETATLVRWLAAEGARVETGQRVVQIETSKAVVDLEAPVAGILHHEAREGDEIPIGAALGHVAPEAGAAELPPPAPPAPLETTKANGRGVAPLSPAVRRLIVEEHVDPSRLCGTGRDGRLTKADVLAHLSAADAPAPTAPRFSRPARELIERLGLDPASFAGFGLVRSRDVRPEAGLGSAHAEAPRPAAHGGQAFLPAPRGPVAMAGVPTRAERLPRAKRTEARYLRAGLEHTLPSAVTVTRRTRGLRAALGETTTAVIVAETARLLRKYPAFNAHHDDGEIHYYEEINIGVAVDAGRGLKVPVIPRADTKSIGAIADELRERVVAYLDDRLPVEALTGGTFTITDLSGYGVTAFHPLINQGQSAILGICAEILPPGSGEGTFNLVLAFDHQLAEGRSAALFLSELGERLAAYEAASRRGEGPVATAEEPRCARCQAGYAELRAQGHPLIQSVGPDGSPRLLCRLCLEGWR